MTGLRAKDDDVNNSYYGHILIDKINFSYTDGVLQSNKSIIINLGLEQSDIIPYTGNGLIDVSFNQEAKEVYIFTLSASPNSFVPVVYLYNINEHNLSLKYPSAADKDSWGDAILGNPVSSNSLLSISNNVADIMIQSSLSGHTVMNVLTFDIMNSPTLTNYSKYSVPDNLNFDIVQMQRVNNELQFFAEKNQSLIPFKITDK